MIRFILIGLFSVGAATNIVNAKEIKNVEDLNHLMKNSFIKIIDADEAKLEKKTLSDALFNQAYKANIKKSKNIKSVTGKVINLKHQKINKVNFTDKFIISRLNAQSLALGATGIASLKQQPSVDVQSINEPDTLASKVEDKTSSDIN